MEVTILKEEAFTSLYLQLWSQDHSSVFIFFGDFPSSFCRISGHAGFFEVFVQVVASLFISKMVQLGASYCLCVCVSLLC